jgi:serine O-acetyltransferase
MGAIEHPDVHRAQDFGEECSLGALQSLGSALQAGVANKDIPSRQARRQNCAASWYWGIRMAIAAPLLILYTISKEKSTIQADCERWMELLFENTRSPIVDLLFLLSHHEEFRSLYYYRAWQGTAFGALASLLLRRFYKPAPCLYLRSPEIGSGFFLQHGFATTVGAYRVGRNCSVNQLVVIGWTDRTRGPILGDNVSVKAGAKVLGPITVGDNVVIGANAVVLKDVPANCVVVGAPARIVRRNGVRVNEAL